MLARTRTASSIVDGGSADTGLDSVISISSSASAAPQLPRNTETILDLTAGVSQGSTVPNEESQNSLPGPSTAPLQRSNVRTYAGRSRSFLVELPADGSAGGGMDADDLGLEMRESYKDLRMRWGVDNSEDDPHPVYSARSSPGPESGRKGKGKAKDRPKVVLPPNMMNDLKSITELRSKGESRRFMDEVGYLFEGMDQSANIRVRRSSALELVTKLCDSEFARRAKATDFRSRSWDALRAAGAGDGDKVLDAILVLFAALVAESPHEVNELIQKEDFVPVLWDMLATFSGKDPLELIGSGANDAQLKNAGVGKAEKLILARLRSIILSKTVLVSDEDHLSLRQLLSQALASIPPSAHHPKYFEALYHTLLSGLRPLSSRLSGYASGLPLLPEASQTTSSQDFPQFDHIANCLVILDSYLLGRWPSSDEHPALCDDVINGDEQKSLAEGLATLCVVCSIILRNGRYEEHISIAARCIESALRVLITLSHENIAWCRLLMKQKLMVPVILSLITGAPHRADSADDETDEHDAQAFDRLCLALGLLTNLVQVDESAKDLCRETKLDPSCAALRPCAYTCSCPDASSALRCLTSVYSHYLRAEDDDPGTHIIRGHLAVLFGLLMRGALDNQDIILDELPGTGLEGLIRNAKEFVGLYTEFMARIARGEGRGAEGDAEDEPEVAVAEVRVRDGATEDVAKGVIRFLEELRGR
ncbi:hypothetical protein BC834DRAFT_825952 [Gloeopeniophorella convolvens]|nr:hypothetical protein BC834DRAFT_825952 [Gloeopeniophorella convolvens]